MRTPAPSTRPSPSSGRFWDGLLSNFQAELPDEHASAHAQRLEPVPVHGDLQPLALDLDVRDGHRPRHGLPRLEPGHPRLRAHDPRARARAHPRHRRDPALRRHLLPPVPAPHEEGQRRGRRRLLRRPPLARALDLRLHQGDGRPRHPGRGLRLRGQEVQARRERQADQGREPPPPPRDLDRLHDAQARPPRAAPHRPRRLERLPQPQLLLDGAQRELPVRGRREGLQGRVGDDRRPLPLRARARWPSSTISWGGPRDAKRMLRRRAEMLAAVEARGLGRRVVPPRLRRRGQARRLEGVRGGQDLHREPGLVRPGRGRRRRRARACRGRARKAMESVHKLLYTPKGVVLQQPRLLDLPPRARRGLELSARGQGERGHLQPQQHLDPPGLVPPRRGRPGPRVLPLDLPERQAGPRSTSTAPSPTSTRR